MHLLKAYQHLCSCMPGPKKHPYHTCSNSYITGLCPASEVYDRTSELIMLAASRIFTHQVNSKHIDAVEGQGWLLPILAAVKLFKAAVLVGSRAIPSQAVAFQLLIQPPQRSEEMMLMLRPSHVLTDRYETSPFLLSSFLRPPARRGAVGPLGRDS